MSSAGVGRLGHSNLGITSVSLLGIESREIIETVRRVGIHAAASPRRAVALREGDLPRHDHVA
jgi:hypothetical protein